MVFGKSGPAHVEGELIVGAVPYEIIDEKLSALIKAEAGTASLGKAPSVIPGK